MAFKFSTLEFVMNIWVFSPVELSSWPSTGCPTTILGGIPSSSLCCGVVCIPIHYFCGGFLSLLNYESFLIYREHGDVLCWSTCMMLTALRRLSKRGGYKEAWSSRPRNAVKPLTVTSPCPLGSISRMISRRSSSLTCR